LFLQFGSLENEESLKINPGGTGIGLKHSNILAQLLGPKKGPGIQVNSIYGRGSNFHFILSYTPYFRS